MSLYSNNYNSGLFWNVVTFLGNNLILLGLTYMVCWGFPGGSDGEKKNACNAGEFLVQEDPLEKRMATYSSILAWRIPWTATVHGVTKIQT